MVKAGDMWRSTSLFCCLTFTCCDSCDANYDLPCKVRCLPGGGRLYMNSMTLSGHTTCWPFLEAASKPTPVQTFFEQSSRSVCNYVSLDVVGTWPNKALQFPEAPESNMEQLSMASDRTKATSRTFVVYWSRKPWRYPESPLLASLAAVVQEVDRLGESPLARPASGSATATGPPCRTF